MGNGGRRKATSTLLAVMKSPPLASVTTLSVIWLRLTSLNRTWSVQFDSMLGGNLQNRTSEKSRFPTALETFLEAHPMFSVPLTAVTTQALKNSFLEMTNWSREQDGHLIGRLKPESEVGLFGPGTNRIRIGIERAEITLTKKYMIAGNLVVPNCISEVAKLITSALNVPKRLSRSQKSDTLAGYQSRLDNI